MITWTIASNSSLLSISCKKKYIYKEVLSCKQQKLCPPYLHICPGHSYVSRLPGRYVLPNKGSRWASPGTPSTSAPLTKLYLQTVTLNKFHEWRPWMLSLFSGYQKIKQKKIIINRDPEGWSLPTGLRANFIKIRAVSVGAWEAQFYAWVVHPAHNRPAAGTRCLLQSCLQAANTTKQVQGGLERAERGLTTAHSDDSEVPTRLLLGASQNVI